MCCDTSEQHQQCGGCAELCGKRRRLLIKPSKTILLFDKSLIFYLPLCLDAEKTPILAIPAIILPRLCTYKFSFYIFSSAGNSSEAGFAPVLSDSFAESPAGQLRSSSGTGNVREVSAPADGTGSVQLPAPPGAAGTWNLPWRCPL